MSSLSTLSVDVQKPDVDRTLHSQHVDSRHLAKDLARDLQGRDGSIL